MSEREEMDNTNTQMILESIRDLKTDMNEKIKYITNKLDDNFSKLNEQGVNLSSVNEAMVTVKSNVSKLWVEVEKLRDGHANLKSEMVSHLSVEISKDSAATAVEEKKFNWINLLTPLIITVGLFVLGFVVNGAIERKEK